MIIDSRSPLRIFKSVVFALMLRELHTRFGKLNLGYVWAIIDPATQVILLTAILGFAGQWYMPGVAFPVFVITGVLTFGFFRTVIGQTMSAVDGNRGLFVYRQVKPIDAMLARTVLEVVIHVITFFVLLLVVWWFGFSVEIYDPLRFSLLFLLFVAFSFGLGLFFSVVSALFNELKRIIPLVLAPFFFISGVFYPMKLVPEKYQIFLIWNPLLHFIELFREYYFESYPKSDSVSLIYVIFITLSSLWIGLSIYRVNRFKIMTS